MTRAPQTKAAVTAAIATLLLAGCGKDDLARATSPAPPPTAAANSSTTSTTTTPSTSPASSATRPPSVLAAKASKPSRRNLPRKVRRRDVEDLARRFTRAWTTLELGEGDPEARRELAATITPQFAAQLRQMQMQPRADLAEIKAIDVIQRSGRRRWTAVVRLMRHGATEYLQPQIARRDGRLLVTGMSW